MIDRSTPEHDLPRMLATLDARSRPGAFVFVATHAPDAALAAVAQAIVREDESITYIVDASDARALGHDATSLWAWLTLGVHSALDAVGLTAAVSTALATRGIACNLIAGQHHDHVLVPFARCDDALSALSALAVDHGVVA